MTSTTLASVKVSAPNSTVIWKKARGLPGVVVPTVNTERLVWLAGRWAAGAVFISAAEQQGDQNQQGHKSDCPAEDEEP